MCNQAGSGGLDRFLYADRKVDPQANRRTTKIATNLRHGRNLCCRHDEQQERMGGGPRPEQAATNSTEEDLGAAGVVRTGAREGRAGRVVRRRWHLGRE